MHCCMIDSCIYMRKCLDCIRNGNKYIRDGFERMRDSGKDIRNLAYVPK